MNIPQPTLKDLHRQAITCREPNIAVFGVPGSGKTRIIVDRLHWLLSEGVKPEAIGVITLTNRAAREIEHRLRRSDAQPALGYCGTIQGLLLRRIIEAPGLAVVHECLSDRNLSDTILDVGAEALRQPCYDGDREPMFEHLLWDEYEDVTLMAHEIFLRLPVQNRFVTASPEQSIFGWRGAQPRLVAEWAMGLPPQSQFRLETSYRCGRTLCAWAARLLPHPQMTSANEAEDYVHVHSFAGDALEIQAIADDLLSKPHPSDCAVLFRTNALLAKYRLLLHGSGVPVALEAPKTRPDDYERVAAYLGVMATHSCDALPYDWNTVGDVLKAMGASNDMCDIVNGAKSNLQPDCSLWEIVVEMQYLDLGLSNCSKVVHTSTIHGAKGLEFDFVYLPAFEEKIIPSSAKSADQEEERRLAYVALTRARSGVWISYCGARGKWDNRTPHPSAPSPFIQDMTGDEHP